MRIGIYARVSTDKQENENQLIQLRDYCGKQGWTIVAEYVDVQTGSKSQKDRPQLCAMMKAASQHKFDTLLFWALNRLSREGVIQTLHYLEQLTAYGVGYRSFTEQYLDSCGVFKDAVIAIMAALAKQERIQISERTKAGLARVKAAGKTLGRPKMLNGEHTAHVARLRSRGLSLRAIGRELGISDRSVRRLTAA
jgi:DNA invertase Pin-like site-specific DNA recombinase